MSRFFAYENEKFLQEQSSGGSFFLVVILCAAIVLVREDETWIKLGAWSLDPSDWTVHFSYQTLDQIPEPSSLALFSLGIMVVVGWAAKQKPTGEWIS